MPHPLTIFHLRPIGERAQKVVEHPSNRHLVSMLDEDDKVIDIGHVRSTAHTHSTTLATLGRNGDVFVEGSIISKVQCSFEIDPTNKSIMFHDLSHNQTSQVFGENPIPFQPGRVRKVLVHPGLNTVIGMGGAGRNLVQFQLIWVEEDHDKQMELIENREVVKLADNPRFARTLDEADTVMPSQRVTRIHTPGPGQPAMRCHLMEVLGRGNFGMVQKAIHVDTGRVMAVKIIQPRQQLSNTDEQARFFAALKREVETVVNIKHPCFVDYIAVEDWDGSNLKIFMGLKEGTLASLVQRRPPLTDLESVAKAALHDMLRALDYLTAERGMIHRDVKPDNILYVSGKQSGQYQFQLGDLGLSNHTTMARTMAGTPIFMAPELWENKPQTDRVDVWSLFVTILWTLDVGGFRAKALQFKNEAEVRDEVVHLSGMETVSQISAMARLDPKERASAAQMLVKCFDGEGLVTPRDKVPPLDDAPAPAPAPASATMVPATANVTVVNDPIPAPPPGRRRPTTTATTTTTRTPREGLRPHRPRPQPGRIVKSKAPPRPLPAARRSQRARRDPSAPTDDDVDDVTPMDIDVP